MLLENREYQKDVKAAAALAGIVWNVAGSNIRQVVSDAIGQAVRVIVETYRAELVAKYGEHSDEDLVESVEADVRKAKQN